MPTPYGSRGGMAFSADELRVLRRALAIALQPDPVTPSAGPLGPDRAEEVQDCLRLAEAVDEAVREGGRLRAFLLDELARYRAALPGAAVGYLEQLQGALAAGYEPLAEDLAALRTLCGSAAGGGEATRRRALLSHCERLAERGVRTRLAERAGAAAEPPTRPLAPRLRALPGGVSAAAGKAAQGASRNAEEAVRGAAVRSAREAAQEAAANGQKAGWDAALETGQKAGWGAALEAGQKADEPKRAPRKKPVAPEHGDREEPRRGEPARRAPRPGRPVPTPAEVFPPKRRPSPPPEHESRLGPDAGARSA
ncbi:hypothetical protein [Streptomyces sp. S465]|uniref:hypothetical protein n=1 Tax=Streptomyces sp. S465 TaxID=2979468 RepID=UPI0022A80C1E|nr:hypothetical protein [Streptomyces sp. S465]WAP56835.1 hypothetical protein N6H00_18785 [Streptomyces sp. S465]